MIDPSEVDLGTEVFWRVGEPTSRVGRHGREYDYHVASGRILSLGKTTALVESDTLEDSRRLHLLFLRRLHLTEAAAASEQWPTRDACPLCGGPESAGRCVEKCVGAPVNVRSY